MKSMLKIAKIFGNETTNDIVSTKNNNFLQQKNTSSNSDFIKKKDEQNYNSPNFFV